MSENIEKITEGSSEETDINVPVTDENVILEKEEEAKLKAKYPQALRPGGSTFLQKRLQRGQKYFDSGDYNMAKAKCQKARTAAPLTIPAQPTGDEIPTPDAVLHRKTSLVQSKLATGLS